MNTVMEANRGRLTPSRDFSAEFPSPQSTTSSRHDTRLAGLALAAGDRAAAEGSSGDANCGPSTATTAGGWQLLLAPAGTFFAAASTATTLLLLEEPDEELLLPLLSLPPLPVVRSPPLPPTDGEEEPGEKRKLARANADGFGTHVAVMASNAASSLSNGSTTSRHLHSSAHTSRCCPVQSSELAASRDTRVGGTAAAALP